MKKLAGVNGPKERASLSFALIQKDLPENSFSGMASVFNNMIDSWMPTRILPGAFTKTLQENQKRVKVLYQHNPDWPIGLPTKMEENSDGLYVEASISKTTMGSDVLTLLRDGVITELSIGFDPIRATNVEENIGGAKMQVRHIAECRLWEFSPVTFAANDRATINNVHSLYSAMRRMSDIELTEEAHAIVHGLIESLTSEMDSFALLRAMTEQFKSRAGLEAHAGKVLSEKNRQLVLGAQAAMLDVHGVLQKLLDAAEPKSDDTESRVKPKSLTAIDDTLRGLDAAAKRIKVA